MKNLKNLLTTAILLLSIISCSKGDETDVKGRVIDKTTLEKVPNAIVFLTRENIDCFSCQASKLEKYTADGNGEFSFTFIDESNFIYRVIAKSNGFWDSASGGVDLDTRGKNTILLPLQPEAFIRLFIKNTTPFDGTDRIGLAVVGGGGHSYYGATVDTILVKRALGNSSNPISWAITKNNIVTSFSHSLYCPSFDTTDFIINY